MNNKDVELWQVYNYYGSQNTGIKLKQGEEGIDVFTSWDEKIDTIWNTEQLIDIINKLKQNHYSYNYDIMHINRKSEEVPMADKLYDTVYMGDYDQKLKDLSEMALFEDWSTDKGEFALLKNYLSYTLDKLEQENKIVETNKYFVFNTGLFSKYYEEIYLLAKKSTGRTTDKKKWSFYKFCTEYDLSSTDIDVLPERADYFSDPTLLVFNWHYDIRVYYKHILEDHPERLPISIRNNELPLEALKGAIDNSIKRVIANYKLAVPQYFNNKIQLLIPLYFGNKDKPELALTLEKKKNHYSASTCLTLDMAYNNARLIAKPESNWLTPN